MIANATTFKCVTKDGNGPFHVACPTYCIDIKVIMFLYL